MKNNLGQVLFPSEVFPFAMHSSLIHLFLEWDVKGCIHQL